MPSQNGVRDSQRPHGPRPQPLDDPWQPPEGPALLPSTASRISTPASCSASVKRTRNGSAGNGSGGNGSGKTELLLQARRRQGVQERRSAA